MHVKHDFRVDKLESQQQKYMYFFLLIYFFNINKFIIK